MDHSMDYRLKGIFVYQHNKKNLQSVLHTNKTKLVSSNIIILFIRETNFDFLVGSG
jgi:hypothetical protein